MPRRIQRRRTKGWRMPAGAIYVGRPSRWGNPWTPANSTHITMAGGLSTAVASTRPMTLVECVAAFRASIDAREFGYGVEEIRAELRGRDLACWCDVDAPCHADVLLDIANL